MVVYRYRFVAFDADELSFQVPGAVTFQDIGSVFVDIDAPIASKDDLDAFMQTQGFEFFITSPVNSPAQEAGETDGFVMGPGISTTNAVAVFTGTDGYTIGSSTVTIDSSGNIVIPGNATISGNLNTSVSGDLSGSLPNPTVVDLTITGEQQGSILYFNGSNWVQLPPAPNSSFVLRSAGPSANPFWA
ncbi:MAG: hypothetical protein HC877_24055, partial [Thioploca sp.]|nr:hypothetical protein [Thioploca sp.]